MSKSTVCTVYCTLSPVKLYPPTNLTADTGTDLNLWSYWNQTASNCVESEIRYRINNKEWQVGDLKERSFFHVYPPFKAILFLNSILSSAVLHSQSWEAELLHQHALQ